LCILLPSGCPTKTGKRRPRQMHFNLNKRGL